MVEGIPAFFAASRYGGAFVALMAFVFALSAIVTYSTARLQRVGPIEQYGRSFQELLLLWPALYSGLWPVISDGISLYPQGFGANLAVAPGRQMRAIQAF
jgi:hypothetical protein